MENGMDESVSFPCRQPKLIPSSARPRLPETSPEDTSMFPLSKSSAEALFSSNLDSVTDPDDSCLPGILSLTSPCAEETNLDLPLAGGLLAARYQILKELGRGGMGMVYLVQHKDSNQLMVLKMLLSGCFCQDSEREQFRLEIEVASRLRHPGVVAVHESGEVEGFPYYCMDYVAGPSLTQLLSQGPLPCRESARLLRQIALAVQHTHEQGFLHRDLKPANILLDSETEPHLIDFGLAQRIGDREDRSRGAIVGTPLYVAPEQATGRIERMGPTADIYSLGAILYEMLTGRPPFGGPTLMATIRQVLEEKPKPPSQLNPQIHPDLEIVCLRCLAKDPGQRYPSAQVLVEKLDGYLKTSLQLSRFGG